MHTQQKRGPDKNYYLNPFLSSGLISISILDFLMPCMRYIFLHIFLAIAIQCVSVLAMLYLFVIVTRHLFAHTVQLNLLRTEATKNQANIVVRKK